MFSYVAAVVELSNYCGLQTQVLMTDKSFSLSSLSLSFPLRPFSLHTLPHLIICPPLEESGACKLFGSPGNHGKVDWTPKHRDICKTSQEKTMIETHPQPLQHRDICPPPATPPPTQLEDTALPLQLKDTVAMHDYLTFHNFHIRIIRYPRILYCPTKPCMMCRIHFGWTYPSNCCNMWSFQMNLRQGGGAGPGYVRIWHWSDSVRS